MRTQLTEKVVQGDDSAVVNQSYSVQKRLKMIKTE